MVSVALSRFGSVDLLINNAGVFAAKPFLESTEEDLDHYYKINLKGTYLTTQAVVRQMQEQDGGSIINVGTVLTKHAMTGRNPQAELLWSILRHVKMQGESLILSKVGLVVDAASESVQQGCQ